MEHARIKPKPSDKAAALDGVEQFLTACANVMLDRTALLESAAGRVSELVMGDDRPNRELVVALQSFDRLTQEFHAIGEALLEYGGSIRAYAAVDGQEALAKRVIDRIAVGDLKAVMRRMTEAHASLVPQAAFAAWPVAKDGANSNDSALAGEAIF